MTAPSRGQVQHVAHVIIGTPAEVETALSTAVDQGRLVRVTRPRRYDQGRVRVDAVLIEQTRVRPAQKPSRGRTMRRRYRVRAVHVMAAAGLSVPGIALILAIQFVLANLALITGGLLVLAALLLALRTKTGICMGLHCEGCGHR